MVRNVVLPTAKPAQHPETQPLMKEKISAIILGSIRHSDRHNVTNVFTRERGRMALLTPAGGGRSSRQSAARLLPLSVVEAQINVISGRDLCIPSGLSPLSVWKSIYVDPMKSAIAIFISEFLSRLLREAAPEESLWDFIRQSVAYLDAADHPVAIANFHIAFLVGMSHLTGIFPDTSGYVEGMEFDMAAGRMVYPFNASASRAARIDSIRSALLPKILRINYSNSSLFRFSSRERTELLSMMVRYFGVHFPGSDRLRSLDVLSTIFS